MELDWQYTDYTLSLHGLHVEPTHHAFSPEREACSSGISSAAESSPALIAWCGLRVEGEGGREGGREGRGGKEKGTEGGEGGEVGSIWGHLGHSICRAKAECVSITLATRSR
jgi:hypothetical protein